MDPISTDVARRTLFAAGGLATLAALAGGPATAAAAEPSATEKANLKLVEDFCHSWNDTAKSVAFLAPDASVRMVEDQPAVVGPQAVAAVFKQFMGNGETIKVDFLTNVAHGPVVVNTRVDTLKTPGKPDQVFRVVGVFVVKGGKIKEWADYLLA